MCKHCCSQSVRCTPMHRDSRCSHPWIVPVHMASELALQLASTKRWGRNAVVPVAALYLKKSWQFVFVLLGSLGHHVRILATRMEKPHGGTMWRGHVGQRGFETTWEKEAWPLQCPNDSAFHPSLPKHQACE